ncbi:ABC transporter substrate-binding protein [Bdellovibrionota bacterium FG-2]
MSLRYLIVGEPTKFSVSPYDSDALSNLTVMEQVVGTLVKYNDGGRYEPYLAERWDVSEDGRIWEFFLRLGLKDDASQDINSESYVAGLAKVLRFLAKTDPHLPVFENLEGWDEFIKSGDLKVFGVVGGEKSQPQRVQFRFKTKPDGFLEYLAMPYYGYYNVKDFALDNSWKNSHAIIASGAYRVDLANEGEVFLSKRQGWFSTTPKSPEKVHVQQSKGDVSLSDLSHSIVFKKLSARDRVPENLRVVRATPTILNSIVLSPYISGLFHDLENRRLFATKLRIAQKQLSLDSPGAVLSEFFYPASHTKVDQNDSHFTSFKLTGHNPIKICVSSTLTEDEAQYVKDLVNAIFMGSSVKLEFMREDRTKEGWFQLARSNRSYDIRIARVDIGGNIENWGIKMMFCSNLGIGFPDHTGKLCALTKRYEGRLTVDSQYAVEFNNILNQDLTVIPLWHSGLTWLFTKDVGLQEFSPTMNMPRFDLLNLN